MAAVRTNIPILACIVTMFFEVTEPPLDPVAVLTGCVESGSRCVLLAEAAMASEFFDLSSGLAGELLHKLTTYGIRLAGVVPDSSSLPVRFQEFLREANRGMQFRFFSRREDAIEWLESA